MRSTASADCADKPISNDATSAEAVVPDRARRYRRRGGAGCCALLRADRRRVALPIAGVCGIGAGAGVGGAALAVDRGGVPAGEGFHVLVPAPFGSGGGLAGSRFSTAGRRSVAALGSGMRTARFDR